MYIFYNQNDNSQKKEECEALQKRLDVLATLDCEEEILALRDELSALRDKVMVHIYC